MTVVECIDVAVGYDEDVPILEHVNLEIDRGEIVALIGASGSGKSTLLRTLCGLLPPLAGEVRLFGQSLYDDDGAPRASLLHRIGVAFQADGLFSSMTVADNVALPLRDLTSLPASVIDEMVRMRLELVGIAELAHRHPVQLSGGQKKRTALARASILDPELILIDEPTAGLDPPVAAEIDDMLLQFRAALGSTLVIVNHELASIHATADRGIMLAEHGVIADEPVAKLEHSAHPEVHHFFHARPE